MYEFIHAYIHCKARMVYTSALYVWAYGKQLLQKTLVVFKGSS